MAKHNYSTKVTEGMASAVIVAAPISTKQCIEICNYIRGRSTSSAKKILKDVISLSKPIPYKRFNDDTGHKAGIGPGRFPIKASEHILALLESAEANAQYKGLSSELIIKHIASNKASRPMRYGRQRGRQGKRTTVEVVLVEDLSKKTTKTQAKVTSNKTDEKAESSKPKADSKAESKAEHKTENKADEVKPKSEKSEAKEPKPKKAEPKKSPVKKAESEDSSADMEGAEK